jgi:hypothetical protein
MSDPEAVDTASLGPALTVVSPDGEDRGAVALAMDPIRVGREADNEIVLEPDPAQVISRQHCVIERTTRRWRVRDLESRNHTYLERDGVRAQVDHAELLHGDAICLLADSPEPAGGGGVRYWRLAFTDPGETKAASPVRWLQYFPASETVWALGGMRLSRPVEAPPKARRMLLYMLARYRELDEPRDGVFLSHAELKAALWPEDSDPQIRSDGAVANVAWELRAALGDDDQRLLQTETGAGYRLVPRQ